MTYRNASIEKTFVHELVGIPTSQRNNTFHGETSRKIYLSIAFLMCYLFVHTYYDSHLHIVWISIDQHRFNLFRYEYPKTGTAKAMDKRVPPEECDRNIYKILRVSHPTAKFPACMPTLRIVWDFSPPNARTFHSADSEGIPNTRREYIK